MKWNGVETAFEDYVQMTWRTWYACRLWYDLRHVYPITSKILSRYLTSTGYYELCITSASARSMMTVEILLTVVDYQAPQIWHVETMTSRCTIYVAYNLLQITLHGCGWVLCLQQSSPRMQLWFRQFIKT
jgi:hypothetical protein